MSDEPLAAKLLISRRQVLQLGALSLLSGCSFKVIKPDKCANRNEAECLKFELFRIEDNFSASLEIYGFELKSAWGKSCLSALSTKLDNSRQFIFHFPPHHYAEVSLDRFTLEQAKALNNLDSLLRNIGLLASKPAKLVFGIPINEAALPIQGKAMPFDLPHLLAWDKFEYVLEDATDPYKTDVPGLPNNDRRFLLGFEFWKGEGLNQVSAIDLPTGFYLQPLRDQAFKWKTRSVPKKVGNFSEVWSAFIVNDRSDPVNYELIDIWGVTGGIEGKVSGRIRSYEYWNTRKQLGEGNQSVMQPDNLSAKQFRATPLDFYDRMDIAVTLSPRFGEEAESGLEMVFKYVSSDPTVDECGRRKNEKFSPCYAPDHFLAANTYGISSNGGWLDLSGNWSVRPGCVVKGWAQKTTLGRDTFTKVVRKGWLYPFGFEAELVEETDRSYVRDPEQHMVAPLVTQVFIRLVQPAIITTTTSEECFSSIRMLTERTPPLDKIEIVADLKYKQLDAFIPRIGAAPFNFELAGLDLNQRQSQWVMPLIFISNRQTSISCDGLFPEDGSAPVPNNSLGNDQLFYVQASHACGTEEAVAVTNFIKLVDSIWAKLPFRFARLNGQIVALALQDREGDTSVEIKWFEWVRGRSPDTLSEEEKKNGLKYIQRPLMARVRTARIALQGLRQFAGTVPDMLATYRDMRIQYSNGSALPLQWTLDPEEAQSEEDFSVGVLNPSAVENQSGAFMCILPVEGINQNESSVVQRNEILQTYFSTLISTSDTHKLFDGLGNTVQYGRSKSTYELGGCTPDSPVALLTRQYGPLGDSRQTREKLKEALQVHVPSLHGRFLAPVTSHSAGIINIGLDAIFGANAEILPGIRFADILKYIIQSGGTRAEKQSILSLENMEGGEKGGNAPVWKTRLIGLEGLLTLFSKGFDISEVLENLPKRPSSDEPGSRMSFGAESTLDWETNNFTEYRKSFFAFKPSTTVSSGSAEFSVHARAWVDFIEPKPQISATSELRDFSLIFFDAIVVEFNYVRLIIDSYGRQVFDPAISMVLFKGALSFLEGLKSLLNSLTNEVGLKIQVSPQRVSVSQTISFPPQEGGVVFLGPATISNLSFNWGVIIPIIGRDRLRVLVGLASRENPMTVAVGIYGGHAYALVELDTEGPQLIEVSADYGGVWQANWSDIAKGSVSLTAGFAFCIKTLPTGKQIDLFAFAQFSGKVAIWIFSVCADATVGMRSTGEGVISGVAKCSCSFNLGIKEYSYEYDVYKEERAGGTSSREASLLLAQNDRAMTEKDKLFPPIKPMAASLMEVAQKPDYSGSAHPFQSVAMPYYYPFQSQAARSAWKEFFNAQVVS